MMRRILLVAAAAAVAAAISGCPTRLCGPSTCAGCCVGDRCVTGKIPSACGAGGTVCTDCTRTGTTCVSGACTPVTPLPPDAGTAPDAGARPDAGPDAGVDAGIPEGPRGARLYAGAGTVLAVSPSGARLAYSDAAGAVKVQTVPAGTPQTVIANPSAPVSAGFFGEGTLVVYTDLRSVQFAGTNRGTATVGDAWVWRDGFPSATAVAKGVYGLDVAANGGVVAALANLQTDETVDLVMGAPSGTSFPVVSGMTKLWYGSQYVFAPDSQSLYLSRVDGQTYSIAVYRAPTSGGAPSSLASGTSWYVALSGDGKTLYYIANFSLSTYDGALTARDIAAGTTKVLEPLAGFHLVLSDDGALIAHQTKLDIQSVTADIVVRSTVGGAGTTVASQTAFWARAFTPDSKVLVYEAYDLAASGFDTHLVGVTGGTSRLFLSSGGYLRASTDSRRVAGLSKVSVTTRLGDLVVAEASGTTAPLTVTTGSLGLAYFRGANDLVHDRGYDAATKRFDVVLRNFATQASTAIATGVSSFRPVGTDPNAIIVGYRQGDAEDGIYFKSLPAP